MPPKTCPSHQLSPDLFTPYARKLAVTGQDVELMSASVTDMLPPPLSAHDCGSGLSRRRAAPPPRSLRQGWTFVTDSEKMRAVVCGNFRHTF